MMEGQKKIVGIKCNNAECGKQFRMYAPENGGLIRVACPYCKQVMVINFGEPEKPAAEQAQCEASQSQESPQPQESPQQAAQQPKKPTRDLDEGNRRKGKLVQRTGFLRRDIEHRLRTGDNIIGRYDVAMPSTIQITGDPTMSRQSVNIQMKYDEQTLCVSYLFRVKNAKNPVTLNGRQLTIDEEVYLKFGDTFTLGSTTFKFVEA